jgi:plastocyanin
MAAMASGGASTDSATEVKIDNFAFTPGAIKVKPGTQETWINHDDIPHTVDSTQGKFKSAALDTDQKFEFRLATRGVAPQSGDSSRRLGQSDGLCGRQRKRGAPKLGFREP